MRNYQYMRALWAEFCRSSACQAQHHDQRYQRLSKQLPDAQRRQLLRQPLHQRMGVEYTAVE